MKYFLHIFCFFAVFNSILCKDIIANDAQSVKNKSIEEIIKNEEKIKNEEIKQVLQNVNSNKNDNKNIKEIVINKDKQYSNEEKDNNNNKNKSDNKDDESIDSDLKGIANAKENNIPSSIDNTNKDNHSVDNINKVDNNKKDIIDNSEFKQETNKAPSQNSLQDAISELQSNDLNVLNKNNIIENSTNNENDIKKNNKNDDIAMVNKGNKIIKDNKITSDSINNDNIDDNFSINEKNDIKIEIISEKEKNKENKKVNDNTNDKKYNGKENNGDDKNNNSIDKKEEKTLKHNNVNTKNKNIFDKIFTIFDFKKALDVDFNTIKYQNYGFLENIEEKKIIKQMVEKTYKEPEKENINGTITDNTSTKRNKGKDYSNTNKKRVIIRESNILKVYSLVYFNKNDWKCKINKKIINNDNLYDIFNNSVSILNVNKGSVTFMLRRTSIDIINMVKAIQDKKSSYYYNYYIINDKGKEYVVFKLFIGQKIDLNTMKISG